MGSIEIRRPKIEDTPKLHTFFRKVITDTFASEGIPDLLDDIEREIESKKTYLKNDFDSNGKNRYFLIALDKNKIIGTIEHGPASELIYHSTDRSWKKLQEIGTVFVHPDHQRQGIGTLLLNVMFLTLLTKEIKEFCLDSGYTNAQKIWTKKFGDPDYLLKDYWDEGYHHMIWRKYTEDMPLRFYSPSN